MKTYVIRPGHAFRMPDGSLKSGGEQIELSSDVALTNAGAVDEVHEPEPDATPAAA